MTMLVALPANARDFHVNSDISLRNRLREAEATPERDRIFCYSDFTLNGQVRIDTPVALIGAAANRGSVIRRTRSNDEPMFNITSNRVTIRNLTLVGTGENTTPQTDTEFGDPNAPIGSNSALINLLNTGRNGETADNFTCTNNRLRNSAIGIGSIGALPRELRITGNRIVNCNRGIELFRDVARANGDFRVGGFMDISGNRITGRNLGLGISVDAGNDGFPFNGPGFPVNDGNRSVRRSARDVPTLYSNVSRVNGNTVRSAQGFAIAFAQVGNIYVVGNNVRTANNRGATSAGINVEHNAQDIRVMGNTIEVATTGPLAVGITLLPFQDHGATANHRQSTRRILLRDNIFRGTGESTIFALGYNNLRVINNDARDFTTRNQFGVNTSFFNINFNGPRSTSSASGNRNFFYNLNTFNGNGNAPQSINFN